MFYFGEANFCPPRVYCRHNQNFGFWLRTHFLHTLLTHLHLKWLAYHFLVVEACQVISMHQAMMTLTAPLQAMITVFVAHAKAIEGKKRVLTLQPVKMSF